LNEEKFKAFLILLHNFDNNSASVLTNTNTNTHVSNINTNTNTNTTISNTKENSTEAPLTTENLKKVIEPMLDKILDSLKCSNNNQAAPDIAAPIIKDIDMTIKQETLSEEDLANNKNLVSGNGNQKVAAVNSTKSSEEDKQICFNNPVKSCMAMSGYKDPFRDDLYENMKAFQNTDLKTFKTPDPNALADVQNTRNLAELRYACGNNSYFANLERQMASDSSPFDSFLKPSVRNTRYGSFLEDAGNTKVGSIMPSFLYKELKN
jgi:hypothetical protein